MNEAQKNIVRSTWAQVRPIADTAAILFYEKLFEINPTAESLFEGVAMAEQRTKLMTMLSAAVGGLDDLNALIPQLEALARRHVAYGVTDAHYDTVGAALLSTLQQGLGTAWTPEAAEAWTTAYGLLSGVMRRAAAEEEAAG